MKTRHSFSLFFSLFSVLASSQVSAGLSAKDYPDLYGSVLFDKVTPKTADIAAHQGYGDNYGSSLLDKWPSSSEDIAVHPGYGDSYGSILLDLPAKTTTTLTVKLSDSRNSNNI
jgi:hypothetical protein